MVESVLSQLKSEHHHLAWQETASVNGNGTKGKVEDEFRDNSEMGKINFTLKTVLNSPVFAKLQNMGHFFNQVFVADLAACAISVHSRV